MHQINVFVYLNVSYGMYRGNEKESANTANLQHTDGW